VVSGMRNMKMINQIDIQEEIDSRIEYYELNIPYEIHELINKSIHDLNVGPTYYNKNGDECTCHDEGAILFNFNSACEKIREYMDLHVFNVVMYYGEEYEETIDGSDCEIVKGIVGKELFKYL
jgi:hypothetical protein